MLEGRVTSWLHGDSAALYVRQDAAAPRGLAWLLAAPIHRVNDVAGVVHFCQLYALHAPSHSACSILLPLRWLAGSLIIKSFGNAAANIPRNITIDGWYNTVRPL